LTVNGSGFNNPKVWAFTSGDTNVKDIQLVTTPVSPTQLTAVFPVSQFTVTPGVPYGVVLVVENADGSRSGKLIFQITAAGELAAAEAVDESSIPLDDFPVEDYPIVAEVEPDETPGPYPLDKPKPAPPAKKATQGAPIESPAAAKKATPPAAKKAQPPKGESKE